MASFKIRITAYTIVRYNLKVIELNTKEQMRTGDDRLER